MSIRNLRVATRINVGFAALLMLLVAVGAGSLRQMQGMHGSSAEVEGNWLPSIIAISHLDQATWQIRASTLRALASFDITTAAELDNEKSELARAGDTYRGYISSPEEQPLHNRFDADLRNYLSLQNPIIEHLSANQLADAEQLVNQKLNEQGHLMNTDLAALTKLNEDGAKNAAPASSSAYQRANLLVGFTLAGAVLMALVLPRSIVRPLSRAVQVASAAEQQAAVAREVDRSLVNMRDVSRLAVELSAVVASFRL
ncbi:MCP four helix bundle domain-containing protein [Pseudomonas solani]|uniref:MCP four helix bundle domain-containing protein n=1 Tax=Pseudomonas solani TaxID=2731552 RepID=UPI0035BE65D8